MSMEVTSPLTPAAAVDREKVILKSSDKELFEVDRAVIMESVTLKKILDDGLHIEGEIPLLNVTAATLKKVLEYIKKHLEAAVKDGETVKDDLNAWDANFVNVDTTLLFDLIMAADFLHIDGLLNLITAHIAGLVQGMNVEQIRQFFNITNDFTPEDEAEILAENQWAFE